MREQIDFAKKVSEQYRSQANEKFKKNSVDGEKRKKLITVDKSIRTMATDFLPDWEKAFEKMQRDIPKKIQALSTETEKYHEVRKKNSSLLEKFRSIFFGNRYEKIIEEHEKNIDEYEKNINETFKSAQSFTDEINKDFSFLEGTLLQNKSKRNIKPKMNPMKDWKNSFKKLKTIPISYSIEKE